MGGRRFAGRRVPQPLRQMLCNAAAPVALRLALGEVPDATDRAVFARALADNKLQLPAIMRGLLHMPQGQAMLRRAAAYAWHWGRAEAAGSPFFGPAPCHGNIYTAWTGPAMAFLHFEKCGGIALAGWLCGHFHPEQIAPGPYRDLPPHLFSRPPKLVARKRYPLIWGHYDLPSLQRFDAKRAVFTIFREPKARLTSLYQFWRSVNPAMFNAEISFAVGLAQRLSFEDFLKHDDPLLSDSIDNVYVRRLTGLYATGAVRDPLAERPEEAVARAIEALDGLALAGVAEQLDKAAVDLACRFGLAPPEEPLTGNVTAENQGDPSGWFRPAECVSVSAEAADALESRTRLDQMVYQRVLAANL